MTTSAHLSGLVALWVLGLGLGFQLERTVGARVPGAGQVVLIVYGAVLVVMTLALSVVRVRRPDRGAASLVLAATTLLGLFFLLRSVG